MFIPQGKVVYENLATSYVLLDALVDDVCEGGFSGVVEVVLRDTDSHVIIDNGRVAAVIERAGAGSYSRTSVAELAGRARAERGRISVYSYSSAVAGALADRAHAEPLYTQLSTDFADPAKMVLKLARERDRQWFIEIYTAGGARSLVQIKGDLCQIITPEGETSEVASSDLINDPLLGRFIDECNRAGGAFDVYFIRRDQAPTVGPGQEEGAEQGIIARPGPSTDSRLTSFAEAVEAPPEVPQPEESQPEESQPEAPAGQAEEDIAASAPLEVPEDRLAASFNNVTRAAASDSLAEELAIARGDLQSEAEMSEAETLAEVKRLMSEIARTIEEVTRDVEQRESFAMYLRAGQLGVTERYPFLDPFGDEFEYLAGEIAFIGQARPDDFITGLTEALRLATDGVIQSSSQPGLLRSRITADLRHLLERNRAELEPFGLDRSIEEIMSGYRNQA